MKGTAGGWLNGFIGVIIFSGSLPATRVAVMDFDPAFLTSARAAVAGLLALAVIGARKALRPTAGDTLSLAVVALGVVIGFPLLTALALQHITAAHSIVFIGLLPLSTALFAVLRGGERPRPMFWLLACLGSSLVAGFAIAQGGSASASGNAYMVIAIAICGLGYAEGARLSRTLGGWQVISWALVLSLPVTLPACLLTMPTGFETVSACAWLGLAYVSLFSMFLGFVFWYRGLAQGGIAAVGQLQLLQPFLGLALSATLLKEPVTALMVGVSVAVVLCVVGVRKVSR